MTVSLLVEQGTATATAVVGVGMTEVAPQGEDEIDGQEGVAYII